MSSISGFPKLTKEKLATLAALHCSNPDCGVLTKGAAQTSSKTVSLGEAAHIYGLKPNSSRYRAVMSDVERNDVTNGIWLCRNCHKKIDSEPELYMADLLFEWRKEHEAFIASSVGTRGAVLRNKIANQQLQRFKDTSYLAQRIVLDKPDHWEYKLAIELLRSKVGAVLNLWGEIEQGVYARPIEIIDHRLFSSWMKIKFENLNTSVGALEKLIPINLMNAFGKPGVAGSELEILRTCELLELACQNLIEWELSIKFSYLSDEFIPLQEFLSGTGRWLIQPLQTIQRGLESLFADEPPVEGHYEFVAVFDLPKNFAENYGRILNQCTDLYLENQLSDN